MIKTAADYLREIATTLTGKAVLPENATPHSDRISSELVAETSKVYNPISQIVQNLYDEKSGNSSLGDDLYHAQKHLGQLVNVITKLASGKYQIDSPIGIGRFSDFIIKSDSITRDLNTQLDRITDKDIPESLKSEGITVDVLKDRLKKLAQRIDDSGIKTIGESALMDIHDKEMDLILNLADCGTRDGLDSLHLAQIHGRRRLLAATVLDDTDPKAARDDLKAFYETLPEIKNGDHKLTAQEAEENDFSRIVDGVAKYQRLQASRHRT